MNELQQAVEQSPFAASELASDVDLLFYAMLTVCGFVALGVTVAMLDFCIRYRSGKQVDRTLRLRNLRLPEYIWIGVPLLIFLGFFVWGATLFMRYQQLPPEDALRIHGVGKQWMWKFYHPGGQREINELHIPVDRPVVVVLSSEDVIHSFFVPAFRVKQDAVPGRYTRTAFTASEPGTYRLFCAEFCGLKHSKMRGQVEVMSAQHYAEWLDTREQSPTLAAAGEALFRTKGCSGCHAVDSAVHAPDLRGIYGRIVHLRDGRSLRADVAYLRDSILLPEKDVVAGYQPIMPSFADQLTEEELLKILAFLQDFDERDAP
ncbi:cytochrome c oxidase subunit II [Proteobacteria bacterium 005FR1]|nr:cytochrome c oxidase subunit II [Proteobacteria bacterium 005FR1]